MVIPYGEKLWQEKRLVNLANDHKFAEIYPTNVSNEAEAIVINFYWTLFPFCYNANTEVWPSSIHTC